MRRIMKHSILFIFLSLLTGCYRSETLIFPGQEIPGLTGGYTAQMVNIPDNRDQLYHFHLTPTQENGEWIYKATISPTESGSPEKPLNRVFRFYPVADSQGLYLFQYWLDEENTYAISIARWDGHALSLGILMRETDKIQLDPYFREIFGRHNISPSKPAENTIYHFYAPVLIGDPKDILEALQDVARHWEMLDRQSYPALVLTAS